MIDSDQRSERPVRSCHRESMAQLRDDTCATIDDLDVAAKGRASIVRSCGEAPGLTDTERETLRDLLRCITEQRKRLRALRRLWQSLDVFERPTAELLATTEQCLVESREFATALEPWRARTTEQVTASLASTWSRVVALAGRFDPPARGRPQHPHLTVAAS